MVEITNSQPTRCFDRWLRNSLVALLVGAALVVVCYLFVDRPVAFYVHHRRLNEDSLLKWLTYPPPELQLWSPALLAWLMIRRAWGPFRPWEQRLLAAGVGVILADQFRESLSDVCGRYWPETWINHNPSFIHDGAYGFHWFQTGSAFGSFPSGHSARTAAVAAVVWIAYPKWRGVCGLAFLAEAAGLIGMNYHFVSDVIAGGFIGGIVGAYTVCLCEPEMARDSTSPPADPS